MTKEIVLQIVSFLLGGVFGVIIKSAIDYRKEILSKLWQKRFDEYIKAWKLTEVLPQYPKDNKVTYFDLSVTSTALKDWYFTEGGILLSTQTRKAYGKLQEKLNEERKVQPADKVGSDYEEIRLKFSSFRTGLTKDLTSRSYKLFNL